MKHLTWWSNFREQQQNEKYQKIVMNQIKSTKRLTVDDFPNRIRSTRNIAC